MKPTLLIAVAALAAPALAQDPLDLPAAVQRALTGHPSLTDRKSTRLNSRH